MTIFLFELFFFKLHIRYLFFILPFLFPSHPVTLQYHFETGFFFFSFSSFRLFTTLFFLSHSSDSCISVWFVFQSPPLFYTSEREFVTGESPVLNMDLMSVYTRQKTHTLKFAVVITIYKVYIVYNNQRQMKQYFYFPFRHSFSHLFIYERNQRRVFFFTEEIEKCIYTQKYK